MAAFSEMGQALLDHLKQGNTTVCRCWKVARRDGVVLGFTDHDCALEFEGVRFLATSGFTASALEQGTGLAVDNTEAVGALSAEAITETDIQAGRFDGAEVTSWLVNWSDPDQRLVQFSGTLGEVTRTGDLFKAELRGLAEALNQPHGKVYQATCSAVLGDGDCGFDLDTPGYAVELTVEDVTDAGVLVVAETGDHAARWFERGRLVVIDGEGAGLVGIIKCDDVVDSFREIELWQGLRSELKAGDRVRLEPGCNRRPAMCKDKFGNFLNFRGFPHVPGEDWLTAYPKQGDDNDGGSRNG